VDLSFVLFFYGRDNTSGCDFDSWFDGVAGAVIPVALLASAPLYLRIGTVTRKENAPQQDRWL